MGNNLCSNDDLINELVKLRKRNEELEFLLKENKLSLQEQFFDLETIYNTAPVGLCVLDKDLRFVHINQHLAKLNGIPIADHIGRTPKELLPGFGEILEQGLRKVLATNEAVLGIELEGETPAQPELKRWWETKWFPVKDALGQTAGINVVVLEITERKRAEQKLKESEEKLRLILVNSADAISMLDLATGKYIFMSSAHEKLTGFTPQDMNGWSPTELYDNFHPDDHKVSVEQHKLMTSGLEDISNAEYRWKVKCGEYRWFSSCRKLVRNEKGKPYALVSIVRDITQQKEAEEALKKSEAKYRTLFNSMNEGHCVIDVIFDVHGKPVDWRYLEVNPAYEKQGAFPSPIGKFISELTPQTEEYWFELYGKVAQTGIPVRSIIEFKSVDRWYEVNAYKIGGDESKTVGVTFHDITERKKRESENAFQAELLANVYDAIVVCDENQRLTYVNKSYERMFGWTAKEVVGRSFSDFESSYLSMESRDNVGKVREKTNADAGILYLGDITCYSKSGDTVFVNAKSTILKGTQGEYKGCIVALRDVSRRKQMEEDLRKSKTKLELAINAGRLETWEWDVQTGVITVSDQQVRTLGFEPGGDPFRIEDIAVLVDPEDKPLFEHALAMALEQGGQVDLQYRLRMPNDTLRWVEARGFTEQDEKGNPVYSYGVTLDVTRQKMAEQELRANEERLKALNEQLRQSDQNKSHFLSVLSHELRNPLASIMMGIELQKRAEPGGNQEKQAREIMERQGKHLTRLVDDLLDITRISENKINLRKECIDLNNLIKQVAGDNHPQFLEKGVRLSVELAQKPIHIEADQARIVQVIGNLIHNALKFTKANDKVTVAVASDRITKEAIISVKDTGGGISPELLPKLFTPFFQADDTLARSCGGLGLGLAIAKGMVQLHGGTITAESEGIGKGTRFVIRLPLLVMIDNNDKQESELNSPSRSLRILIIDDIPDISQILALLLGMLGHTAETALSGIEGIAKAKEVRPDVIICDIGLPDMSGYEVARSIRSEHDLSNVRLIALSGYAQEDDQGKAIAAGFQRHLAKPVDMNELRQVLIKLFD